MPDTAPSAAQATGPVELRFATLAPVDSPLGRGFTDMDRDLSDRSSGAVRVRLFGGGAAGDERTIVRKLRDGQLDGAALTSVGLGAIAREVLVLQAPGLITSYEELDRVRGRLQAELARAFEREGFTILGWGDAGRIRLFSTRRIERPGDMRSMRPWVWRDSPTMGAFVSATGATGVSLSVNEVLPALSTGMVDTVITSSVSAIGMQWHGRLRTISQQASGVIVGGVVVRSDRLAQVPAAIRDHMLAQGRSQQSAFRRAGRRLDERASQTLFRRMEVVDMEPYRAAWDAVATRARDALVGRLYTRAQLDRVRSIVEAP
ncbi:MAG: TRAP transporter substrate-binding protein DctP [Myxococcales bacterium]|nr:TRAP transporter substrate-binding protein DctP [Myxococcales bacterium]